jgi:F-type H+-transporting ATPase subunit alpha
MYMVLQAKDIAAILKRQIEEFEAPFEAVDVGSVMEVGDGIARADGLAGVMAMELVEFPPKPGRSESIMGLAFNLEADNVGIIIMGEYSGIDEGDMVKGTGRIVSVPVGDGLVGRVVKAPSPPTGTGPLSASHPTW